MRGKPGEAEMTESVAGVSAGSRRRGGCLGMIATKVGKGEVGGEPVKGEGLGSAGG